MREVVVIGLDYSARFSAVHIVLTEGNVSFCPTKGLIMSPEISKPEWFQLAEADATPAKPKSRKRIRLMALATPLLVLGAGLAYAQTQDSSPANAGTTAQASASTASTTITKPALTMPTGGGKDDGQERSSNDN